MRIIFVRDEPVFWVLKTLMRNRRRGSRSYVYGILAIRLLPSEIDRVLQYLHERRIIRITRSRIYMYHDIDVVYTYFPPQLLLRDTGGEKISRDDSVISGAIYVVR